MHGLILSVLMAFSLPGKPEKAPFVFEKIIFHTTRCFGSCPVIDMEIDSKRRVVIHRAIYKGKSQIDKKTSGNFKGKLDLKTYRELIDTLKASDYTHLKFPAEFCCDAPVVSIIVYANGQRTEMASMFPPQEAQHLVAFLRGLGLSSKFPRTTEKVHPEEVNLQTSNRQAR